MSNGQPFATTGVNLITRDHNSSSSRRGATTQADGTFEIKGVAPGRYELEVRPANARSDDDVDIGRGAITVLGDDIDDVFLVGSRPAIARGKVVTDDGTPLPFPSMTVAADMPGPGARMMMSSARVNDDSTFELKGLFGPRLFRMGGFTLPPGGTTGFSWTLKAVLLNGVDIIDKPIDFLPGALVEGLELVFTQKAGELSGTVTADRGELPQDTQIILFPADESLWADTSRFVRAVRPDKNGSYRFRMLPARDDYLLVSAIDLEPNQFQDPEFLREVRDRAIRLSVYDNEKKVQNIRMATSQ